jgi:hypothetical protein
MLRVKASQLTNEHGSMPHLDLVQWVHKNNKFQKDFGFSFRFSEGQMNIFLETNCAQLMNAVQAKWPDAVIDNV